MAALSVSYCFPTRKTTVMQGMDHSRNRSSSCGLTVAMVSSSPESEPAEESSSTTQTKKEKRRTRELFSQILTHVQKTGTDLKHNLSPQRKGDRKDVVLMSLSFAVYVYVSQKIVCAYCVWKSMADQSW